MSLYNPNHFIILKFDLPDKPEYKVLGSWSGGCRYGDSWRMNSGISSYEVNTETGTVDFIGYSGSVYQCRLSMEGQSLVMSAPLANLKTLNHITQIEFDEFVKEFNNE